MYTPQNSSAPKGHKLVRSGWVEFGKLPSPTENGYFLGKWSRLFNWVNASRVFSRASRFSQLAS